MSRSVVVGQPAVPAEARIAREHDGLATLLDAKLVEYPGDVVANRLLRDPKGLGNLRVVETLGDAFKHGTFTSRKFVERQRIAAGAADAVWFGEKTPDL